VKTRLGMILILVLAMILASCTIDTNNPLNNTSWYLVSLGDRPLLPDTDVTIRFEDGRMGGNDGCNWYGGAYTVRGDRFSVDNDIHSTLISCSEPVMGQVRACMQALRAARRYRLDGQQLTLLDASGKALVTFAAQSQELAGTSWIVTSYNNGEQAVVGVLAGSQLTVEFDADGGLSGSAGCNRYTAPYAAQEQSLSIGPAASTRMMCAEPAGVMEQEAQFLKALETVATYRIDGNRLELRTADGALALSLSR
jgi:heat shock protein HslJ